MKNNIPVTNIHLKPNLKLSQSTNFLDKLINLFGLNVWGDYFLSESSRIDMRAVSILMSIIFVFDLLAWTMLFNLIFNSGRFEISNLTILAFVLGLLLSIVTIIFERNIFVTDTEEKKDVYWMFRPNFWMAIARVMVVLFSAFITAQPIHMRIFRDTIMERHQEEQIIAYAVATSTKLNEKLIKLDENKAKLTLVNEADLFKKASARSAESPRVKTLNEEVATAQKKIDDLDKENKQKRDELLKLESELKDANEALNKLKGGLYWIQSPKREFTESERKKKLRAKRYEIRKKNKEIKELETSLFLAKENAKLYITDREQLEKSLSALKQNRAQVIEEITEHERKVLLNDSNKYGKELKIEAEKLTHEIDVQRDFIAFLRSEKLEPGVLVSKTYPATDVIVEGEEYKTGVETHLSFNLEEIGFAKQFRIFHDVEEGTEPKWPMIQMDEAERNLMREHFKIQRFPNNKDENSHMRLAWQYDRQRLKSIGNSLWYQSIAAYFIGMFIPLMVILFKMFIPRELKLYYSARYQAYRGHPEAMKFIDACDDVFDQKTSVELVEINKSFSSSEHKS